MRRVVDAEVELTGVARERMVDTHDLARFGADRVEHVHRHVVVGHLLHEVFTVRIILLDGAARQIDEVDALVHVEFFVLLLREVEVFFELSAHLAELFANDVRRTQFARARVDDLGAHGGEREGEGLAGAGAGEVGRSDRDGDLGEVAEGAPAGVGVKQTLGRVRDVAVAARDHRSAVALDFFEGAHGFLVVRVTHHDDVGVFARHAQAVGEGFVLRNRRVVGRVGFRDDGAAEAMHGVFMRATRTGRGLEEERVENLALQEIRAGAHEGFEHFGRVEERLDFVAGEVVQERDVLAAHVRGVEVFADVAGLEAVGESHL